MEFSDLIQISNLSMRPIDERLTGLVETMKYVTKNYKDLVIFYLYYDSDNPNKTQTFYSVDLT
jgi:hypothetical protein